MSYMCDICMHRKVCRYREDFVADVDSFEKYKDDALAAVTKDRVPIPEFTSIRMELVCNYYHSEIPLSVNPVTSPVGKQVLPDNMTCH